MFFCSFVAIMKGKRGNISRIASKATALFMLGVFSFIVIAQAFHHHQSSRYITDPEEDGACVYAADKCKVCDYIIHKQSKHALIYHEPIVKAPSTKPITPLSRAYAGIYKFTLQGFSNKGPPTFLG